MSQIPRPEASQGRSAVVLTPPARHGHLAVLGTCAEIGRAPLRAELEHIARGLGADPVTVLAELAGRDAIAFDGSGGIRAADRFSPSPTPIQVTWAGGPASTRCGPSTRSACPPCWTVVLDQIRDVAAGCEFRVTNRCGATEGANRLGVKLVGGLGEHPSVAAQLAHGDQLHTF